MLGLGLVVGIIALLLGGTLLGLLSYRATMSSIKSKMAEEEAADELKHLADALQPPDVGANLQYCENMQDRLKSVREKLRRYQECLDGTVKRGRDPDNGHKEY